MSEDLTSGSGSSENLAAPPPKRQPRAQPPEVKPPEPVAKDIKIMKPLVLKKGKKKD